jgi:hypothetical protein
MAQEIKTLRTLQIIVTALPIGGCIFAAIILLLLNETQPTEASDDLHVLRWLHLGLTIYGLIASKFLGDRILSGKMKTAASGQPATFFQRYSQSIIVRLAIIEGNTLFGMVIFLIASEGGLVKADASYYLHLLPLCMLIVASMILYPTEEKMMAEERKFS